MLTMHDGFRFPEIGVQPLRKEGRLSGSVTEVLSDHFLVMWSVILNRPL